MTLTICRGIPGSGKTTFAKNNFQCCILENDQLQIVDGKYCWSPEGTKHAIAMCFNLAEQILASGADVCVVNTFTKKKYIRPYEKLAETYGAKFKVIRLVGEFQNTHNVPANVFAAMKAGFETWEGEEIVNP